MVMAHKDYCSDPTCGQLSCTENTYATAPGPQVADTGFAFERMVAMTTANRKRGLLDAFAILYVHGSPLDDKQKEVLAERMEVIL